MSSEMAIVFVVFCSHCRKIDAGNSRRRTGFNVLLRIRASTPPAWCSIAFGHKMKLSLKPFLTWIVLAGVSMPVAAFGESPEMVPPSSGEWKEIYDPPTKVPAEIPGGSKLRSELFDLLRAKASPATRFSGSIKAFRNWAFFLGRTVDRAGNSLRNPPHGNDDAVALWLRTEDGWVVVAHSFGHSDAFYVLWPEQYGVPRELLGMKKTPTAEQGGRGQPDGRPESK